MTGKELTDEELQEIADTYGLYTEQDVENRVSCELLRIGARNEELEKENEELKNQIEKMKCCGNCACLCECGIKGFECENYDKWEIKENDL